MKYLNNHLYKDYKSLLCIGTDSLNTSNLPNAMKQYMSDALINGEETILFTNNILYKDIENNFNSYGNFIRHNINRGKFKIKAYDGATFDYDCKEFLEMINIIYTYKGTLKVIWDF